MRASSSLTGDTEPEGLSSSPIDLIPTESYDPRVAEAHGRLLAHGHRTGTRRGAHDLMIAATAAVTRRTIVTTDRAARFGDRPQQALPAGV